MFQDLSYDAMLNLLDDRHDVEMTDQTEYMQMKQYLQHQSYQMITIHSRMTRESILRSSRKPSITTVEFYSTP
eukprot:2776375-Amphidinium_carterae.1